MSVRILTGDCLAVLRTLPAESAQVCVCSPPYYQLRDYGVEGQIGLEQTPAQFVAKLVAVFDEVRRVLRPDGLCFVNLGDSYAGSGKGPSNSLQRPASCLNDRQLSAGAPPREWNPIAPGLKAKDLMLIPERFAIAMQDAGWYVRSRIAWCKTSAMPESVRDRPTSAWEHIWMFSKSRTYYYDAEAVRQPLATAPHAPGNTKQPTVEQIRGANVVKGMSGHFADPDRVWGASAGANLRNYWLLGPEPSKLEHYAGFPTEIPRRCILAGTSEKGACPACGAPWRRTTVDVAVPPDLTQRTTAHYDTAARYGAGNGGNGGLDSLAARMRQGIGKGTTGWAPSCACDAGDPVPQTVLDPFLGSGTTCLVAERLGRESVGVELSPTYAEMARARIYGDAPMFASVELVS